MTRATEVRRRAPRLRTQLDGTLIGRQVLNVEVIDLSLTGCLVRIAAPFDQGAILDLELRIVPSPLAAKVRVTSLAVDGEALASDAPRYLMGLEFMGLSAQGQAQLRQFLEEERRRSRPPA